MTHSVTHLSKTDFHISYLIVIFIKTTESDFSVKQIKKAYEGMLISKMCLSVYLLTATDEAALFILLPAS